ncbi:MarR family winged helix-turn-helix transcriptional regulator [Paenibacillus rigui]|uniref:MarR family transcriptional regulator n=1 Tax=Paenibacillus rigui TaxID=554312 RepID=A0A229UHU1_9BACL|nr:MarR family winged helix-turn-helix transcriptional regulator [Paenibacillus rigui]OXM82974.1 MarR family transcriptional regulator [Paenibacillus rigui]
MGGDMNPAAQELMRAFRQFGRASWQHRSVDGMKSSEMMTLFCIRRHMKPDSSGMKVSEISGLLQVTSPTVTQMINSMEEQGLVERAMDPSDRRAVRVKLTDKGEQLAAKMSETMSASFNGLVEHLGEEQSRQLAVLLNKACEYYDGNPLKPKDASGSNGGGEE